MQENQTLRVFVIDDTAVYRKIITDILSKMSGVEVIGKAPNGKIACDKMREMTQAPDIIFLDIYMPEMDGIQTLIEIQRIFSRVLVVMISGVASQDTEITMKALKLGAIDFISKTPNVSSSVANGNNSNYDHLEEELKRVLKVAKMRLPIQKSSQSDTFDQKNTKEKENVLSNKFLESISVNVTTIPTPHFPKNFVSLGLVVIGVSTGGPNALAKVVPLLPKDLRVPVLIVQHMPEKFTATLANILNDQSQVVVKEAEEGEEILPGFVYIAPGGLHMRISKIPAQERFVINTNNDPPVNFCRPSVNVLMQSVARNWQRGSGVLAVIMTGIGKDGMDGIFDLKKRGAYCIAQDKNSSVVFGMPKSVIDIGLADEIVPLDSIANRITKLIDQRFSLNIR